MAGIPKFTQGKLASSVVGTPGVDLSTANIYGTAAKVFGRVAEEDRKKKVAASKEQAKKDALINEAKINSSVTKKWMQANSDLELIRKQAKDEHQYNEQAGQYFDSVAGEIEDPAERAAYTKKVGTLMTSNQAKVAQKFRDESVDIVKDNVDAMTDIASKQVSDDFSLDFTDLGTKILSYDTALSVSDEAIEAQRGALGAEATEKQKKRNRELITKSAITSLIDSNPDQVEGFLNKVGDIIPKDEAEELRNYATDVMKARAAEAKAEKTRVQQSTATTMASALVSGKGLSQGAIQEALVKGDLLPADAERLRKYIASDKKVFLGDNNQSFSTISNEYVEIAAKMKAFISSTNPTQQKLDSNLKPIDVEDVTFQQVAKFRQNTLEAMENGAVSQATGARWLAAIEPKFNEGVEELFKSINNKVIYIKGADNAVNKIIRTGDLRGTAKAQLRKDLMNNIDKWESENGKRATTRDLNIILFDTKQEFVHNNNPNRVRFSLGEVILAPNGGKYKVVGRQANGDPKFSKNLNKKIEISEEELELKGLDIKSK